jgi:PEP-CTERM/exosortase A-associated glycosyltransferase
MIPQPLSVLHILDHSRPVDDGYAFRSHAIVRCQQARGWAPIALTCPKHFESWRGERTEEQLIDTVRYHRTGGIVGSRWPFVSEGRTMRATAARARALIADARPSVIHAHSPVLNALPAIRTGRAFSIPVVYEMRASWEDAAVSTGKYGQQSWKYHLTRAIETMACRWADHVVVICEGLRQELISRGLPASKMTVIPNGVDLDAFRPQNRSPEVAAKWNFADRRIVAFIGSFFHWEGLELLVDAAGIIRRERDDVRFLLVGGGDRADDIQRRVMRLALQDVVLLPGRVPPPQVNELYALADVMAYPRHSIRLTEIVTPLKPLEAMAMGRAVVASGVGGHRELIADGETGLLFKPGDASALATALLRVLDDEALRHRLEGAGRQWVTRERSWLRTTRDYDRVYDQAISARTD